MAPSGARGAPTEFQRQLAAHRAEHAVPGYITAGAHRSREVRSLLFDRTSALAIETEAIRERAVEALDDLFEQTGDCYFKTDAAAGLFASSEFAQTKAGGPASFGGKLREFMTAAESEAADAAINEFIYRIANVWHGEAALLCLEYFLRVYSVHKFNAEALTAVSFPDYDLPVFLRLAAVLIFPEEDSALAFLPRAAHVFLDERKTTIAHEAVSKIIGDDKARRELARRKKLPAYARQTDAVDVFGTQFKVSLLVDAAGRSADFFRIIIRHVIEIVKVCHELPQRLLRFVRELVAATFENPVRVKEKSVRAVLPLVFVALKNPQNDALFTYGLDLALTLCESFPVSADLWAALTSDIFLSILTGGADRRSEHLLSDNSVWVLLGAAFKMVGEALQAQLKLQRTSMRPLTPPVVAAFAAHQRTVVTVLFKVHNADDARARSLASLLFPWIVKSLLGYEKATGKDATVKVELDEVLLFSEKLFERRKNMLASGTRTAMCVALLEHVLSAGPVGAQASGRKVLSTVVAAIEKNYPGTISHCLDKVIAAMVRTHQVTADEFRTLIDAIDRIMSGNAAPGAGNALTVSERLRIWTSFAATSSTMRLAAVRVGLERWEAAVAANDGASQQQLAPILLSRVVDDDVAIRRLILGAESLWRKGPIGEAAAALLRVLASLWRDFFTVPVEAAEGAVRSFRAGPGSPSEADLFQLITQAEAGYPSSLFFGSIVISADAVATLDAASRVCLVFLKRAEVAKLKRGGGDAAAGGAAGGDDGGSDSQVHTFADQVLAFLIPVAYAVERAAAAAPAAATLPVRERLRRVLEKRLGTATAPEALRDAFVRRECAGCTPAAGAAVEIFAAGDSELPLIVAAPPSSADSAGRRWRSLLFVEAAADGAEDAAAADGAGGQGVAIAAAVAALAQFTAGAGGGREEFSFLPPLVARLAKRCFSIHRWSEEGAGGVGGGWRALSLFSSPGGSGAVGTDGVGGAAGGAGDSGNEQPDEHPLRTMVRLLLDHGKPAEFELADFAADDGRSGAGFAATLAVIAGEAVARNIAMPATTAQKPSAPSPVPTAPAGASALLRKIAASSDHRFVRCLVAAVLAAAGDGPSAATVAASPRRGTCSRMSPILPLSSVVDFACKASEAARTQDFAVVGAGAGVAAGADASDGSLAVELLVAHAVLFSCFPSLREVAASLVARLKAVGGAAAPSLLLKALAAVGEEVFGGPGGGGAAPAAASAAGGAALSSLAEHVPALVKACGVAAAAPATAELAALQQTLKSLFHAAAAAAAGGGGGGGGDSGLEDAESTCDGSEEEGGNGSGGGAADGAAVPAGFTAVAAGFTAVAADGSVPRFALSLFISLPFVPSASSAAAALRYAASDTAVYALGGRSATFADAVRAKVRGGAWAADLWGKVLGELAGAAQPGDGVGRFGGKCGAAPPPPAPAAARLFFDLLREAAIPCAAASEVGSLLRTFARAQKVWKSLCSEDEGVWFEMANSARALLRHRLLAGTAAAAGAAGGAAVGAAVPDAGCAGGPAVPDAGCAGGAAVPTAAVPPAVPPAAVCSRLLPGAEAFVRREIGAGHGAASPRLLLALEALFDCAAAASARAPAAALADVHQEVMVAIFAPVLFACTVSVLRNRQFLRTLGKAFPAFFRDGEEERWWRVAQLVAQAAVAGVRVAGGGGAAGGTVAGGGGGAARRSPSFPTPRHPSTPPPPFIASLACAGLADLFAAVAASSDGRGGRLSEIGLRRCGQLLYAGAVEFVAPQAAAGADSDDLARGPKLADAADEFFAIFGRVPEKLENAGLGAEIANAAAAAAAGEGETVADTDAAGAATTGAVRARIVASFLSRVADDYVAAPEAAHSLAAVALGFAERFFAANAPAVGSPEAAAAYAGDLLLSFVRFAAASEPRRAQHGDVFAGSQQLISSLLRAMDPGRGPLLLLHHCLEKGTGEFGLALAEVDRHSFDPLLRRQLYKPEAPRKRVDGEAVYSPLPGAELAEFAAEGAASPPYNEMVKMILKRISSDIGGRADSGRGSGSASQLLRRAARFMAVYGAAFPGEFAKYWLPQLPKLLAGGAAPRVAEGVCANILVSCRALPEAAWLPGLNRTLERLVGVVHTLAAAGAAPSLPLFSAVLDTFSSLVGDPRCAGLISEKTLHGLLNRVLCAAGVFLRVVWPALVAGGTTAGFLAPFEMVSAVAGGLCKAKPVGAAAGAAAGAATPIDCPYAPSPSSGGAAAFASWATLAQTVITCCPVFRMRKVCSAVLASFDEGRADNGTGEAQFGESATSMLEGALRLLFVAAMYRCTPQENRVQTVAIVEKIIQAAMQFCCEKFSDQSLQQRGGKDEDCGGASENPTQDALMRRVAAANDGFLEGRFFFAAAGGVQVRPGSSQQISTGKAVARQKKALQWVADLRPRTAIVQPDAWESAELENDLVPHVVGVFHCATMELFAAWLPAVTARTLQPFVENLRSNSTPWGRVTVAAVVGVVAVDIGSFGLLPILPGFVENLSIILTESHREGFARALAENGAPGREAHNPPNPWWWFYTGAYALQCAHSCAAALHAPAALDPAADSLPAMQRNAAFCDALFPAILQCFELFAFLGKSKMLLAYATNKPLGIVAIDSNGCAVAADATSAFPAFPNGITREGPASSASSDAKAARKMAKRLKGTKAKCDFSYCCDGWLFSCCEAAAALITLISTDPVDLKKHMRAMLEATERAQNPAVRAALSAALVRAWSRGGAALLTVLTETLRVLRQLLEDSDVQVEQLAKRLVVVCEGLTGESLAPRLH